MLAVHQVKSIQKACHSSLSIIPSESQIDHYESFLIEEAFREDHCLSKLTQMKAIDRFVRS